MQLSPSILLTSGLALMQMSSAAPAPIDALSKRTVYNLPPSTQFVTCPSYLYSSLQVNRAIQRGIILTPKEQPQPGDYPHVFGNNRNLPFHEECKGKTLYEFPILHGDAIYGGGEPGADRVVFYIYTNNPDTNPTDDGAYCGVMTHDGAPRDRFALCPVRDRF
ncbi:Ribonuclease/ribotoxin [Hypoxylon rubiginosum]|uniref:Ribonuclease/ribotoxin n=1 Tax=Hypoxylon rubiginosum TaxID=110542 RepID=A0ACC0CVB3_9PEZI|nr:Ribonuclease/ribotoxin [Hypoxylon rubiginosum]